MRDIAQELRMMLTVFRMDPRNAEVILAAAGEIEGLRNALGAIIDAHGPGTLASDEIYEAAVTALNGAKPTH